MRPSLPDSTVLYQALVAKDSQFDGTFFAAVKTTGIFCRPICTARKPKPENVEYFPSVRDALQHGYRPCKICNPLGYSGDAPDWLESLLSDITAAPESRWRDSDLRQRGLEPNRVRRWFKKTHGITFQAYLRSLRIGQAFGRIKYGERVTDAALDSGYESLSGFTDSFKKTTGFAPVESSGRRLILITRIPTPIGPLLAGATDEGICLLEFTDRRMLETQLTRLKQLFKADLLPGSHPLFEPLNRQLEEYFAGHRSIFELPLAANGTAFQQRVWAALMQIPCGETRSYQQQAESIGDPKAVRAVARANGDNRISIIIPCHRVIGKDGSLTGYGGGLERKQFLLNLESRYASKNTPSQAQTRLDF